MSGGSNIRAIGPGSDAQASGDGVQQGEEPLTLDESWAEESVYEETWEPAPSRSLKAILPPVAAIGAIATWTAFFGWVRLTDLRAGVSPAAASQMLVDWSVPTLLVIAVWLLIMRTSRREASRFADAGAR